MTNTTNGPLASFAQIGIVYFDSAGRVVGGDSDFPSAALAPGASAAFNAPIISVTGVHVARIAASCENLAG